MAWQGWRCVYRVVAAEAASRKQPVYSIGHVPIKHVPIERAYLKRAREV